MVTEASVSAVGYFMPIFAFLLVFIVVYALLVKTKILGDNQSIMLFISFILSGFFIVQTSLVEFVKFTSAWFVVGVVMVFFLVTLLGFLPGKTPFEFLGKGNWFSKQRFRRLKKATGSNPEGFFHYQGSKEVVRCS